MLARNRTGRFGQVLQCAFDGPARFHMSWRTIEANLPRIGARRILLSHMSDDMLKNLDAVAGLTGVIVAEDGLVLRI